LVRADRSHGCAGLVAGRFQTADLGVVGLAERLAEKAAEVFLRLVLQGA